MNEKYEFDATSYNQFLNKRLQDSLDENKRYFDNYVQMRNAYNDLLEKKALKKRGKRVANDSDLLNLKKSLKKAIALHKDEIKRLRVNDQTAQFQNLIINQDSKIKKMEGELARKTFLEDKKEKHLKRVFKYNESIRESGLEMIKIITQKHQNVADDIEANESIARFKSLINSGGLSAATAVDED